MNHGDLYLIILTKFGDYSVVEVTDQPVWLWYHRGHCADVFQLASDGGVESLLVARNRNLQQCSDLLQAHLSVVTRRVRTIVQKTDSPIVDTIGRNYRPMR